MLNRIYQLDTSSYGEVKVSGIRWLCPHCKWWFYLPSCKLKDLEQAVSEGIAGHPCMRKMKPVDPEEDG